MTNVVCHACKATSDATLCPTCGRQLHDALNALPGLVDDLQTAATKQARLDQTPTRLGPIEDQLAVHAERVLPAALRSRMGRITLPATRMPVALGATELHRQAVAGIADWLTRIDADPQPPQPVLRTALIIRRNRPVAVRLWRGEMPLATVNAWLAGHAERLRVSTAGPEIHAKALELVAAIEATIDRRDPDEFVGTCPVTDVRVEADLLAGPPCSGLVCAHESCDGVRRGQARITLVPGPCGAPLLLVKDAATVTCGECRTTHDPAEIREATAVKLEDKIGSVREVAGYLRSLELDVTVDKIDGWLRRSRIVDYGVGPTGKLVKVGEVRKYAEALVERAKARRRVKIDA